MRRSLNRLPRFACGLALASLLLSAAIGQEATGTVASARGTRVTIHDVKGGEPQAGDRVTLWDEVPGIGPVALQGTWIVKSVEGSLVTADAEGAAAGAPQAGQQARIKTTGVRPKTGTPPTVPSKTGRTPAEATRALWGAVEDADDPAPVRALIAAGANVNDTNEELRTPLMIAAKSSGPAIVEALLAGGANVNLQSRLGETALMAAVAYSNQSAEMMLKKGADPNLKTKAGTTALMIAAQGGLGPVCELLLRSGADAAARNSKGQSARDLAEAHGHADVVAIIDRATSPPPPKGWKLHEDQGRKTSVSLPERYERQARSSTLTLHLFATPPDPQGMRRVFKLTTPATGAKTLEQARDRLLDAASKHFQQFTFVNKGEGSVSGDRALWYLYTYVWEGQAVRAIAYVTMRGEDAYEVLFAAMNSDFEAARPEFGAILGTVRVR